MLRDKLTLHILAVDRIERVRKARIASCSDLHLLGSEVIELVQRLVDGREHLCPGPSITTGCMRTVKLCIRTFIERLLRHAAGRVASGKVGVHAVLLGVRHDYHGIAHEYSLGP